MKFTISVQLPNGKVFASNVVLDDVACQERGFAPIPIVNPETLLDDWKRNSNHLRNRRANLQRIMQQLEKRALHILATQDGKE